MMCRYFRGLLHLPTLLSYLGRSKKEHGDDIIALREASNWLLEAQRVAEGGGYAHSYHLLDGWQPAYPETTGYIIPSLLRANTVLKNDALVISTQKALNWLRHIQSKDGSFADLADKKQVFDTGQILIGLNDVAEYHPDWPAVTENINRATLWLMQVQENDGSFIRHAYNNRPHTYYSRVGSALVKSGLLLGDETIQNAGIKNLNWTIGQQQQSGFFNFSSFDDHPAFLHTIVYIVEGLLDGFALTRDDRYYQSALRLTDRLLTSKPAGELLRSQYYDDGRIANPHYCMTGLSQWAGVCFRLAKITNHSHYKEEGLNSLAFVSSYQVFSSNKNISGTLPGSIPIYGNYLRCAFPNWGVKFFIDALLEKGDLLA